MENNENLKNSSIGAKILAMRKAKGLTQGDVGAYLNISYQAVSKWERDESCPDFDTLSKLAQLFGVPISFFEKGSVIEDSKQPEEKEEKPSKEMLGVCKDCGKVVYEGEEGLTNPELVCKVCVARRQRREEERQAQLKREAERLRRQEAAIEQAYKDEVAKGRNRGITWGIVIAIIAFGVGVAISWGRETEQVVLGIVISLFASLIFIYPFVSQLFWNGAVVDCVCAGMVVIGEPGVIFTCDLDGIAFLIGMKILFGILRFLVGLVCLLACSLAGMLISPFTYFFALKRVNNGGLVSKDDIRKKITGKK